MIAKAMQERERELAKERQREHGGTAPGRNSGGQMSTSEETGKTRDKIAVAAGLGSSMTMRRVDVPRIIKFRFETFADIESRGLHFPQGRRLEGPRKTRGSFPKRLIAGSANPDLALASAFELDKYHLHIMRL